tara:strand:+ start:591 stop:944 length:354 start_codon:yes stop_codon:yes gene_type:complete
LDNFQFKRSDRVNHEIKDIISNVLTSVVNVEGSGLITVTEVKTSQNLRFSKIYISFMNNELDKEEIVLSMNRNIKEYRYHLGKKLQLKYVPQIKFYYDNTYEEMEHIATLINKSKGN